MRIEKSRFLYLFCIIFLLSLPSGLSSPQTDGQLRGRVVDPFGRPAADFEVHIFIENSLIRKTFTDAQGNYEAKDLPTGKCTVTVLYKQERLLYPTEKKCFLGKGEDKLLDIGLAAGTIMNMPWLQITGTVTQPNGTTLSDVTVTLSNVFTLNTGRDNESMESTSIRTDKTGHFKIGTFSPGQYLVYAMKPGFIVDVQVVVLQAREGETEKQINFILRPLNLK